MDYSILNTGLKVSPRNEKDFKLLQKIGLGTSELSDPFMPWNLKWNISQRNTLCTEQFKLTFHVVSYTENFNHMFIIIISEYVS